MTNIQSTLYGTFPIGDINNAYMQVADWVAKVGLTTNHKHRKTCWSLETNK